MSAGVRHAEVLANGQARRAAGRAGRFLWHFVQMVVVMMFGMGMYMMLVGKPPQADRVPWYAGMELSMILPMIAWMLYRRHGWRATAEMVGAMAFGPAIVLSCAQFGWYSYFPALSLDAPALVRLSDPAMLLGMLAAMLFRREMYIAAHTSHPHAH